MLKAICSSILWGNAKLPHTTTVEAKTESMIEVYKILEDLYKDSPLKIGSIKFFEDSWAEEVFNTGPLINTKLDATLVNIISIAHGN